MPTCNSGFIIGKVDVPFAKIVLQALIGDPSGGKIQIYDTDEHPVPTVDCRAGADGYFFLTFRWFPGEIGKMEVTRFRARTSVILSTTDSSTILQDGVEIPLIVAVSLGDINFSPFDGFPNGTQIISDFVMLARQIEVPPIIMNLIKMSPEMFAILGFRDDIIVSS